MVLAAAPRDESRGRVIARRSLQDATEGLSQGKLAHSLDWPCFYSFPSHSSHASHPSPIPKLQPVCPPTFKDTCLPWEEGSSPILGPTHPVGLAVRVEKGQSVETLVVLGEAAQA
jgi:hypothetical protein